MVREVLITCVYVAVTSCSEPNIGVEREEHELHASSNPAAMALEEPDTSLVALPRSVASIAVAQQGYEEATVAVPPPPPGSTVGRVRLSRFEPSVGELEERLVGMLAVMDLDIDPAQAAAWADGVELGASPDSEAIIAEPLPGVVVTYDAWLDDLAVVNTALFEGGVGQDTDEVPWPVANGVMDALVERGLVDQTLSFDEPEVTFIRSGVKGPDGNHEQWVDEVRFEANALVDGFLLLDAGLRIGITPMQRVSSLRITRIDLERLEPTFIEVSDDELRDAFASHVDGSTGATLESVPVIERRPVYVLEPDASSAIVDPRYVIRYSIVTTDDDTLMGSRTTMVFMSMTNPETLVEFELP